MLALLAILATGCSLLTPAAPSLSYDQATGVVSWNKGAFVQSYNVVLTDAEGKVLADISTTSTQYAVTQYGEFVITVTAVSSRFGNSESTSMRVVRENTQVDVDTNWQATNSDALAEMPTVPWFLNYYYPEAASVRVPINGVVPIQVASRGNGALDSSQWSFSDGTLTLSASLFESFDPGQYGLFAVVLDDGTTAEFRVEYRAQGAPASVTPYVFDHSSEDFVMVVEPAPVSVSVEGEDVYFVYDPESARLTVDRTAFNAPSYPTMQAVELAFSDGSTRVIDVLVTDGSVDAQTMFGDKLCYYYDKSTGGDLWIGLSGSRRSESAVDISRDSYYYATSVDGEYVAAGTGKQMTFSYDRDVLTVKEELLSSLDRGAHYIEIYTRDGVTGVYVYVYSRSLACYDLAFDFDESYPDVILKYSCDSRADSLTVVVGSTSYSSDDHPDMFTQDGIVLTGLVQKNDPVSIKSYFDGEEAVSETITFTADLQELEQWLDPDQGYVWLGEKVNLYIDSTQEFHDLAHYMLLYYDDLPRKSFDLDRGEMSMGYITAYFDFDALGISASNLLTVFNNEACSSYKEAYSLISAVDGSGEERTIAIILQSATQPDISPSDRGSQVYTENESNLFHLQKSSRGESFYDFPILARTRTASVSTSDQLFFAVEQGYLPVPVAGSAAERIYEAAKEVCRTYIDDDMTDAEKVHVIYDWIGANVVYDYAAASEMSGVSPGSASYLRFYRYNCFFLEGVFDDGVAVCNGIAKAVTLLCGIEDITALKANGTSRGVAHAWNKVLVDGVWYIVDATWANVRGANSTEGFTHEYLMISTPRSDPSSGHIEQTDDTLQHYAPLGDYNYFANTWFSIGGFVGNYYIGSAEELQALIDYRSAQSAAEIEFNVFCRSSELMDEYIVALDIDRNIDIIPCCFRFADEDGDVVCDNCGSASGYTVEIAAR